MEFEYKKLNVSLNERAYPIFIGTDILGSADIWDSLITKTSKIFLITDQNIEKIYAQPLIAILSKYSATVNIFSFAQGEESKSFAVYQQALEFMTEHKVTRDDLIIAVGGGVVGDLAGFVAATILRGIKFIQIPTSLLAQVDSSVGGKTGINTAHGKNLVGTFYQPQAVVIDIKMLETLSAREMQAGYAEIVKYGLLGDIRFFEWLEQNGNKILSKDSEALIYAIEKSCLMKAEIVKQDEREETGLRALLNLGHTFAHALETACGYDGRLLHGEAVGIGLVLAANLSAKLGHIKSEDATRIKNHLQMMGMKTTIKDIQPNIQRTPSELYDLMRGDKKADAGGVNFIVLRSLGRTTVQKNIDRQMILSILEESL